MNEELTEEAYIQFQKVMADLKKKGYEPSDRMEVLAELAPKLCAVPVAAAASTHNRKDWLGVVMSGVEQLANDVMRLSMEALATSHEIDVEENDTVAEVHNIVERMKRGD